MHVETERASEKLVNLRLAYVAVSRDQYDVRIYTDDKVKLARSLDRDVSHRSADRPQGYSTDSQREARGRPQNGRRYQAAEPPKGNLDGAEHRGLMTNRRPSCDRLTGTSRATRFAAMLARAFSPTAAPETRFALPEGR